MKNFVRMVMLTAVVAVVLSGCVDDNGANSSGSKFSWNNTCGKDGTDGACKKVVIGGQTWLAENLNYQTDSSWCYDNDNSKCNVYGRLYMWETAQKACQLIGMRLPSNQEWRALVTVAGGTNVAGKKLKAKSSWSDNNGKSGNGTDDFGFSALPGGYYAGGTSFYSIGKQGYWWTATTTIRPAYAFYMEMVSDYDWAFEMEDMGFKSSRGYSVRCVADN